MKVRKVTILFGIIVFVMVYFILKFFTQTEENKNYLTFDGNLEHSMGISGILSEIIPRFNSIYFIETSGRMELTLRYRDVSAIYNNVKRRGDQNFYLLLI